MRNLMLVAALSLGIAAGGCSDSIRSGGIEATDLSAIVVGADRETVEDVLGSPDDSVETEAGRIDSYRYDRGRAPEGSRRIGSIGSGGGGTGFALLAIGLGYLIAQPILIHNLYEEQKGELSITYGSDDTVVRVETAGERLLEELSIVRVGESREQVEGVLGEPDESESGDGATVHVYHHQRGSAKVVIYVTYGPDGTVTRAETTAQRRQRDLRELLEELSIVRVGATREQVEGLLGEPRRSASDDGATVHVYRHQRGSAYDTVYLTYGPDGTVTRAETATQRREKRHEPQVQRAECGDAEAQYRLGGMHEFANNAAAFFWYSLAARNGHNAAQRKLEHGYWSARLAPDQIAEAQRMAAEWEPKDCTAEEIASPSD